MRGNAPAYLHSLAVAVPPFSIEQDEALSFLERHYGSSLRPRSREVMGKVFGHPGIRRRYFALDDPRCLVTEGPDERMERFTRGATELAARAAAEALERAGVPAEDVRGIVVNTCTGYLCPGLSTYLLERLGLSRDVEAVDLVGAGCGGALPNLRLCRSMLNGRGDGAVVSVAVEVCSGTFQMGDDLSLIISNALFGDGAAAAVVGKQRRGLALVDFDARCFPEHRDELRYVYRNGQLHNRLSARLPSLAGEIVEGLVAALLRAQGLAKGDIGHWALHPGGDAIISAIRERLALEERHVEPARRILAGYGNMSSPTVLFVLRDIIDAGVAPGEWILAAAFGAGFSAHGMLLRAI